jgi:hypothetical protein
MIPAFGKETVSGLKTPLPMTIGVFARHTTSQSPRLAAPAWPSNKPSYFRSTFPVPTTNKKCHKDKQTSRDRKCETTACGFGSRQPARTFRDGPTSGEFL